MKRTNYTAAPEIGEMEEFYQAWQQSHVGTYADFIDFMTTPTVEREIFIRSRRANVEEIIDGLITRTVISV